MPIYEFHCKACDADFELMRPVSKMPNTAKCPSCDGRAQRMLTMFAIARGAPPDILGSSDAEPEDYDMGGDFGMDDDLDF